MIENIDIYKEFLRGNPEGIHAIRLAHTAPLFRYGLKFISNTDFVEDAVSEAFEILGSKIGTYNDETHIKSSLHLTVWNKCQNEHRRLRHLAQLSGTENVIDADALESIAIKESNIESAWLTKLIANQLSQLPHQQGDDFRARFFDGKSYETIAGIRGVSATTVRQNVEYARKALRKWLDDKGHTDYLKKVGFFFSKNV